LGVDLSRRFQTKDFDVLKDRAGVTINRDRAQRLPFFGRRCQPDAIPLNRWRRPSPSRNRSLPPHILCLAPRQRESAFIRMTLTRRASEFGPILRYKKEGKKKEGFHHD